MFIDSADDNTCPPPGGPCVYSSLKNSKTYLGS